jgi:hypothetical protein
MPPPTNTYSVTVADAHAHSVGPVSGLSGNSRLDALLSYLQAAQDNTAQFSALLLTDNWTVTISQP